MDETILEVRDLSVRYADGEKRVQAADGVSLRLRRGAVLALVGESGCGKTTVALAALGLLPDSARVVSGEVRFDGNDLLSLDRDQLRRLRGREISMIFQDPVAGLNPVLTVGQQIEEIITAHTAATKRAVLCTRRSIASGCGTPSASPASTPTNSPAACASAC